MVPKKQRQTTNDVMSDHCQPEPSAIECGDEIHDRAVPRDSSELELSMADHHDSSMTESLCHDLADTDKSPTPPPISNSANTTLATTNEENLQTQLPPATSSVRSALNRPTNSRPLNCFSWSRRRIQAAALGCTSSILVCSIRLWLVSKPTAYLIHSVVVLFDMLLIHLFTRSPWLSISGEIATVLFAAFYTLTKETVFELLETTFIAALCSMHMIASRNKHMDREEKLMEDLSGLQVHLVNISRVEHELDTMVDDAEQGFLASTKRYEHPDDDHTDIRSVNTVKLKEKGRFALFFEHFLDGSAGVMYTSFLGLIIDELIRYGSNDKRYC